MKKITAGFNKCPECGAIKRKRSGKKTVDLCSNCLEKLKEIEVETSLLLVLACIKNVRFFLALKPKDVSKAGEFLKVAVRDLERTIELVQDLTQS